MKKNYKNLPKKHPKKKQNEISEKHTQNTVSQTQLLKTS